MDREMLDLAYELRDSKLWNLLAENEIFAVSLPGGETAYCCVMGRSGEHMALSAYVGARGFSTYRDILFADESSRYADLLRQDCVQCSFEKRDQFSPGELSRLKDYCKAVGRPYRAPYPQFSLYVPCCVPWQVESGSGDEQALRFALRAACALAEALRTRSKAELGIRAVDVGRDAGDDAYEPDPASFLSLDAPQSEGPVTVPLFSAEKGADSVGAVPLPPYSPRTFGEAVHVSDIALFRLAKLPRAGELECEALHMFEPVQGEPPYLPAYIAALDSARGEVLPPVMAQSAWPDPDLFVNDFANALIQSGTRPERILVRTDETRALLREFCKKAGIRLAKRKKLPALKAFLDDLEQQVASDFGEDRMDDMVEGLANAPEEELEALPDLLLDLLLTMESELPAKLASRLKKIKGRRG